MSRFVIFISVSILLSALISGAACADLLQTKSYSFTIGPKDTNWSELLSVPTFPIAWGYLQSVTFDVHVNLTGNGMLENTCPAATAYDVTHSGDVSIFLTGGTGPDRLLTSASVTKTANLPSLPAFDGALDFSGPSCTSYSIQGQGDSQFVTTLPADLMFFTLGGGPLHQFTCKLVANGQAGVSGGGNFALHAITQSGADAKVTYTYIVPEPSNVMGVLMGFTGLVGLVRFRKR